MKTTVQEALAAYDRGWILTPMAGKRPKQKGWQKAEPPTREEVEAWASSGNVGVRTGAISGVVVIDDDTEAQSAAADLELPPTVTAVTGGGGRHHYFQAPAEPVQNSAGKLAPDVDVRGDRGVVVLPGGVHPDTGEPYRWLEGRAPGEIELAPLPEGLATHRRHQPKAPAEPQWGPPRPSGPGIVTGRLRAYAKGALRQAATRASGAAEGTRNNTLNEVAFSMGRFIGGGLLDDSEAHEQLLLAAGLAGLEDREARDTLDSGLRAGIAEPRHPDQLAAELESRDRDPRADDTPPSTGRRLTDTGNAETLLDQLGEDLRFCPQQREWYCWNRKLWERDIADHVLHLTKVMIRRRLRDSASIADTAIQDAYQKWCRKSEGRDRRKAAVALAEAEPRCHIQLEDLDSHPHLLNCPNGTLDLRTGVISQQRREDYLTKTTPAVYKPHAGAPTFQAFLERVLPDPELRAFVQRAIGYALTGEVGEQVLFFLYGDGANGKTVLLNALRYVLGRDYSIQLAPGVLLDSRNDRHATEMADLCGVRVAITSEVNQDSAFDEAKIKQLTGGDPIRARRMRQDFWEFEPTHKLFIAANHRPAVRGRDHAIWRRLLVVPFEVIIPEDERDPALPRKLEAEAEGILAWAVEGARLWYEGGLQVPDAVRVESERYRVGEDWLARFIEERLVQGTGLSVGATLLYKAYQDWARETGGRVVSQRSFGQEMSRQSFTKRHTRDGVIYEDVALRGPGEGGVNLDEPCEPNPSMTASIPPPVEVMGGLGSHRSQGSPGQAGAWEVQ